MEGGFTSRIGVMFPSSASFWNVSLMAASNPSKDVGTIAPASFNA
eukprot:Gb_32266 [translate_table: standard]